MSLDQSLEDNHYMAEALKLAELAALAGEAPIGALIVKNGVVVGQGFNDREQTANVFGHAEARAIHQACENLGSWRLMDCTLYVTLEPCLMCSGAILQSRIPRVVFGAADPKGGAVVSLYRTLEDDRLNHRCEVVSGIMAEECSLILRDFFRILRSRKKHVE